MTDLKGEQAEARREANRWVDSTAVELFHQLTRMSRFLNTRVSKRELIWRLTALTIGTLAGRFLGRAEHWGGPDFSTLLSGDITRAMATSASDERKRLAEEDSTGQAGEEQGDRSGSAEGQDTGGGAGEGEAADDEEDDESRRQRACDPEMAVA